MNIVLPTSLPLVENNVVQPYPSPFGQQIYLSSNENTEFSPYDLRGIKVMQQAIKPGEPLITNQLASGLYLLEARNDLGVIQRWKMVKE